MDNTSSNIYRTHDKEIYLQENRCKETKENFKSIVGLIGDSGVMQGGATVRDFGCAAGEFLYYMVSQFPEGTYHGYDVVPDLLAKARIMVPEAKFQSGSVLQSSLVPEASTDVSLMLGVHSIFDDFKPCFSNLIRWTRPGGRIYVLGLFNPHPVDVWVKYRSFDDPDPDHREPGWNLFSRSSVSRYLDEELGPGKHTFIPFEMPFDLDPNLDDPVRTWTFKDGGGRRLLTNGLSLLCNLDILEIRR